MDVTLQNILINSYNSNPILRKEAERALNDFLLTPNFLAAFFIVIDGYRNADGIPTLHHDIRAAATIVVKNNLRRIWSDVFNDGKSHPLSFEEREFCKEKLLDITIKETDNSLKKLLAESIRTICESEYPEKWPALLHVIVAHLQSPNIVYMSNSLLILRKVVKRFEFRQKEERQPLDDLINATFPIIQPMLLQLQDNNHPEAAMIMKLCVKILYSYTLYALPSSSTASAVDVNLWFTVIGKLFCKRLPEASEGIEPLGQPIDDDARRHWPWWKLKKWLGRTMTHFIQRYGNPQYTAEEFIPFAKHFRSHYAIEWLNPIFTVLHEYHTRRSPYITSDVHRYCITFLSNCAEMSPSYKAMKPHLDFILFQVVFPTLCLTNYDVALFVDDPHEFLQQHYRSSVEEWLDPRVASGSLLQNLAKYRKKDVMPRLLPFIQMTLSEYNQAPMASRDHLKKDGILIVVAHIFKILSDSKAYSAIVEPFILHHVLPEYQSPTPLLRYRACWIVEYFPSLKFSTAGVIQALTQGMLAGMRDTASPVQAAAACSLRILMESDETTEIIRPALHTIIGEYFRIMDETESDAVLSALQAIIEKFDQDIYPLATQIVIHLLRLYEQMSQDTDDDEISCFGAIQALDTILAVMEAVADEHPEILEEMQPIIVPIVAKDLMDESKAFEYAESLIHMVGYFTYYCNHVSEQTWDMLRILFLALDDWAFDYFGDFMTPIINFMARDISLFIRYQYNEKELIVQALLRIVHKYFTNDTEAIERDSKIAANLLTCLVIHCKSLPPSSVSNSSDIIIPIFTLIIPRLQAAKTKRLRIKLLEVILAMLYYDANATMTILGQEPATRDAVFVMLFELVKDMDDSFSERLIVLAFSNLLSFNMTSTSLPMMIQSNLAAMLQQTIREIVLLEEEAGKEDQDDDNDDDDDDIEDDEDDADDAGLDDDEDIVQSHRRGKKQTSKNALPEDGYDEEEDAVNHDDADYMALLERLDKEDRVKAELRRANGGEPVDDEEDDNTELMFDSPIEKIDLVVYFLDAMQAGYLREPQLVSSLQQGLDEEDKQRLQLFMSTAEQRRQQQQQPQR